MRLLNLARSARTLKANCVKRGPSTQALREMPDFAQQFSWSTLGATLTQIFQNSPLVKI